MPGTNTPSRLPLVLLPAALVAATAAAAGTAHRSHATAEHAPGSIHMPLLFEANEGQSADPVHYLSRGNGYTLFLTPTEAVMKLKTASSRKFEGHLDWRPDWAKAKAGDILPHAEASVLRMKLVGSNPQPKMRGVGPQEARAHYFVGKDRAQWHHDVATFAKVQYDGVYPGVDMVYYGKDHSLEYDFIVAPHADPSTIRFRAGEKNRLTRDGSLAVAVGDGNVYLKRPEVYQEKAGQRQMVAAAYDLRANGEVGFRLGDYDRSRPLVIDPVVIYSTLLGGTGFDAAQGVALDQQGNVYLTGYTESTDFPLAGAFQTANKGGGDAFVAKVSADGSKMLYCSYLGGTGQDAGTGISVDAAGNAYVAGITDSTDFPVKNALQPQLAGGTDAFVASISANGSAINYATYIGGTDSDGSSRIAVRPDGTAYVTGYTSSVDFPVTENAAQPLFGGEYDGFLVGIDVGGQSASFSTYIGGSGPDSGADVKLSDDGTIVVGGTTDSPNFPTTANCYQGAFEGGRFGDGFVALYDFTGAQQYATFVGGTGSDVCGGIAVDEAGWVYVGLTTDSVDMVLTGIPAQPFQSTLSGGTDAYILKLYPIPFDQQIPESQIVPLSPAQNPRTYSYLGGAQNEVLRAIGVDGYLKLDDFHSVAKMYLMGETESTDFPVDDPVQPKLAGQADLFLTKCHEDLYLVNPQVELDYSSYLGGSDLEHGADMAVDKVGNLVVAGNTESGDFPQHRPLVAAKKKGGGKKVGSVNSLLMRMWTGVPATGGILSVTPRIQFAQQKINKGEQVRSIVVRNLSRTTPLSIRLGIPTAPFSFEGGILAVQLLPGQQVSYPLHFTPTIAGVYSQLLPIRSSDPNRPVLNIRVDGSAK